MNEFFAVLPQHLFGRIAVSIADSLVDKGIGAFQIDLIITVIDVIKNGIEVNIGAIALF